MAKQNVAFRVGITIFLGMVLLGVMVLAVGNFHLKKRYNLKIHYRSVNGVNMYAPVMVSGVEVGSVNDIKFKKNAGTNEHYVEITVALNQNVDVLSDGKAGISTLGLMGEKYVDIDPGISGTKLKENDLLPGVEPISTSELYKKVIEFSDSIKRTMDGINSLLGDESVVSSIKDTIHTAKSIAHKLDDIVTESGDDFKVTMKNIKAASEDVKIAVKRISKSLTAFSVNLNKMVETNQGDVKDIVKNFKSFSETIDREGNKIISDFKVVAETIKDVTVENKGNITESLKNIRVASADLQDVIKGIQSLSDKLNKGEGTLGKLINDKEMGDKFKNIVDNTEKSLSEMKNLLDDFQKHPRKYFRFSAF